jgi:amino acid transporter
VSQAAGQWLRIWIVVDAIIVLCGGVLTGGYCPRCSWDPMSCVSHWDRTGILSACELLHQLSLDRVIPRVFLKTLPRTGAPYVSVLTFIVFSGVLYASARVSLAVVSKMYVVAFFGLFESSVIYSYV